MSKQHKILIGIFCVGVLLCGLGAGIGFMEFSTFTYGGKQIIGTTNMKTENIDVAFEPDGEQYFVRKQYGWSQTEIQTDSRVPLNNVRFQVTYNTDKFAPEVYLEEREVVFRHRWLQGSDDEMALILEAKDLALQNLKERKIISVERVDVTEVVVLVNPENKEDVKLVF